MHPTQTQRTKAAACAIALCTTSGCATGPERTPGDPLEPLNRATFRFNDALDRNIAAPIARTYNRTVPSPIRTGISNFFSNLGDFTVMLNDFAQGRFADGMNDLTRLAFNSTFGVLGLLDIATPAGIQKHGQDFGLTLGRWGLGSGPYLVLPLFGPSSFRDAAGFGVDQYLAPVNQARPAVRNTLWGIDFVSTRARHLGATELLEQAALDKYLFTRDAYLGHRRSRLDEGKEESLPNYGGEPAPGAGQGAVGQPPATQGQAAPQGRPPRPDGG